MTKVLLVEDDSNLREIFEMRLQAEGYETITAGDGEEGLSVAVKEKPDLIIADVMMPRLSGFEMLETLRAAPGMASIKVVMMTALGQAEDQARGEKLGVLKYLVKSQVTLEDFARIIREVLPPESGSPKNNSSNESENKMDGSNPTAMPSPDPAKPADDAADDAAATNPIAGSNPGVTPTPVTDGAPSMADESADVAKDIADAGAPDPAAGPAPAPMPDIPAPGAMPAADDAAAPDEPKPDDGASL